MRAPFLHSSSSSSLLGALVSVLGFTTAIPVEEYSFLDEKPGDFFSTSSSPRVGSCSNAPLSTGTPSGVYRNVNGINTYYAYPKNKQTTTAILILTDIFGLPLVNNPLIADTMAASGYFVVVPDLFNGDAVDVNFANNPSFNLTEWFTRHPPAEIENIVATTIADMKETYGVQRIGGAGYCFGGRYVVRFLAPGAGLDAGFAAHPSSTLPADYQLVDKPLSIAWGELDNANTPAQRAAGEAVLTAKDVNYQTSLYADAEHGFAVRTNLTNPRKRFAQEGAFLQVVRWFDNYVRE